MNFKNILKKYSEHPDFISGIYNYCDRWCERCSFTSRCMNFSISEEQFSDPSTRNLNNKIFWEKLAETFKATLEMIKEMAEEEGIDLDSLDLEEGQEEEGQKEEISINHECSKAANVYADMVTKWFNSAEDLFEEKEGELNIKVELELPSANPEEEAESILDATEIIQWYQYQIYVKIMRAVHGDLEERSEPPDEFPKDSEGSAKVALIAMDRSIGAWGEMRGYFPSQENIILDILVHLDRLRRKTEEVFPDARSFVRPGFDD